MREKILIHISKFISLDPNETDLLLSGLSFEKFKKKEHLLEAGKSAHNQYFVANGCLRLYIVNDKGNEQTLQFAIENWWLADFLDFHNNQPSSFFIQAVEDCEIVVLSKENMDDLLEKIPKLERYFRLCYQKTAGAAQMRIKYLFTMSAEERYKNINSQFPEFVQRVPQYMLASYLDFSAEFMSKIRAGKM
jgi:CRP-like cAMP-binding protein